MGYLHSEYTYATTSYPVLETSSSRLFRQTPICLSDAARPATRRDCILRLPSRKASTCWYAYAYAIFVRSPYPRDTDVKLERHFEGFGPVV